jgi:hypothetical protein
MLKSAFCNFSHVSTVTIKREPTQNTPIVFDYLWLYWILKQQGIPRDMITLIIGNQNNKKFAFEGSSMRVVAFLLSTPFSMINHLDVQIYYNWLKHKIMNKELIRKNKF